MTRPQLGGLRSAICGVLLIASGATSICAEPERTLGTVLEDGQKRVFRTDRGERYELQIGDEAWSKIPKGVPVIMAGKAEDGWLVYSGVEDPVTEELKNMIGIQTLEVGGIKEALSRYSQAWTKGAPTDKERVAFAQARRTLNDALATEVRTRSEDLEFLKKATPLALGIHASVYVDKAIYLSKTRFLPDVYPLVREAANPCVAIGNDISSIVGSGVLVGEDLVLTAQHLTKQVKLAGTKVHFDYERGIDQQDKKRTSFEVLRIEVESKELDYCLLRLKPDANGVSAGKLKTPHAVARAVVRLDAPIVVIGHSFGLPKWVHDDARILFPHNATLTEFNELTRRIVKEFATDVKKQRDALKAFQNQYKYDSEAEHYVLRTPEAQGSRPYMGADCDTCGGDSGGPVFLKGGTDVIGILVAGTQDDPEPRIPGWQYHERILPAKVILEDLAERKLDIATLGLKVR